MTTADKIRELIEEKGVTQRQFAELVGIHFSTIIVFIIRILYCFIACFIKKIYLCYQSWNLDKTN